jgi:hypothetical protein
VEVIKVNQVVVQELDAKHYVAHQSGVVGNGQIDRILYGTDGTKLVDISAHPAQSLGNQRRIVGGHDR